MGSMRSLRSPLFHMVTAWAARKACASVVPSTQLAISLYRSRASSLIGRSYVRGCEGNQLAPTIKVARIYRFFQVKEDGLIIVVGGSLRDLASATTPVLGVLSAHDFRFKYAIDRMLRLITMPNGPWPAIAS